MIRFQRGNILNSDCQVLVNPVNCVGVMGAGLAKQFKEKYPEMFERYKVLCEDKRLRMHNCFTYQSGKAYGPEFIINLPTKEHWENYSTIDDIEQAVRVLTTELHGLGVRSAAVPALGCGCGGLDWQQVKPILVDAFEDTDWIIINLYEPRG